MKSIIINLENANYISEFKLELHFSDGTNRIVDFEPFLKSRQNPMITKYLELTEFKKFKLDGGNIVWGENWDMIFHLEDLYFNNLDRSIGYNESLSQSINL
ncbi:MAG: DUF2442 domain-containing protein [Bacteroidota bacterium]|nr:DUF2442 domain-containing protein [Bacteroidota bacterium]